MDDLLNAIDAAEAAAYSSTNNADLSQERALSIDMYLGKNVDPAEEGHCQVVSKDVFDTIEWIKPSLLKIFAGSEDIVKFNPIGPEDVEAADQETAYTNFIVTQKNPWFQICNDWFTDALLTKNAYVIAYWDTSKHVEKEVYEGQSDEALALLIQDGLEIIEHTAYPDENAMPEFLQAKQMLSEQIASAQMAAMQGDMQAAQALPMLQEQLVSMQPPMLHDVKVKTVNEIGSVKMCVLPPEQCKIDESTNSFMLNDCNYFEFFEEKTISSIRAAGFDIPDDINSDSVSDDAESLSRDLYSESSWGQRSPADPAMRKVKFRMIWIRHDSDGDGISELQYVCRVGDQILHREECTRIPVSSIVPNPVPHRHMGISIADMIRDIADIKTEILRQGIDNLRLSNNPRVGVSTRVNLDDLMISRSGGVVRVDGLPGQEMMPIISPFIFPQAMQGLEYLDQIRENRTGTNRYFTGVDQNSLNKTATGIKTLSSAAAQRVEQIARVFAVGVEELFSIVHELILKHANKKEVVQLRGKWAQVDPTSWKKRTDYTIAVGVNAANTESTVSHLQMILHAQKEAIQIGVATPQNIYNALKEITKSVGFPDPDKFWTDPATIQQQERPNPELEKIKAEREKLQFLATQDMYKEKFNAAKELQLNQVKLIHDAQMKREQMILERELKAKEIDQSQREKDLESKTDILRAKINVKDPETLGFDMNNFIANVVNQFNEMSHANEQLNQTIQDMAIAMNNLNDSHQRLLEENSSPKEIVRDENGRIASVGKHIVVRDANNKIIRFK